MEEGKGVLENPQCNRGTHTSYSKKECLPKTTQNELLECIKEYIHDIIADGISSQEIGSKYGIQADEVTDVSNSKQLGLVLHYIKDGKPIEKLIEYIECGSITGAALCEDVKRTLLKLNL